MKTTIITIAAVLIALTSTAQASYILNIPMERGQGGALSEDSIKFTNRTPPIPVENWQPAEPIYGEWENEGDIYGCNWTPAASLVLIDEPFNQSATDCKQAQTRTKQEREQETTTLALRNIGTPTIENKTINAIGDRTQTALGTALCSYSRDGSSTYWFYNSLGYLVYVNGKQIIITTPYYNTSFTLNGITYKRGAMKYSNGIKYSSGVAYYNEVCK